MGMLRRLFSGAPSPPKSAPSAAADLADDRSAALRELFALSASGRAAEALAQADLALRRWPDDPECLVARASVLQDAGRYRDSLVDLRRAQTLGLEAAPMYVAAGWACFHTGDPAQGEVDMRRATAMDAESADAHFGLAMCLYAQRKLDDAAPAFRRAIALRPREFVYWHMLGNCTLELRDAPAAEACLREAIAIDGGKGAAWKDLAVALAKQDRHAESQQALQRAVELAAARDDGDESFANLAISYSDQGRPRDALALLERELARVPSVDGHYAYAMALLAEGRLAEAWDHYEFRWLKEPLRALRAGSRRPAWTGQDLRGKTILLRVEQGLGDTIQFLRYAPVVQALGARVLLARFDAIAHGFAGVDQLIDEGQSPDYDYYVNLMSLGRIFGTDVHSIPAAVPYLSALPERIAKWAPRIPDEGKLRVGLVWAGSPGHQRDRYRSIPLPLFAPLTGAHANFFSLQKGPGEAQTPPAGLAMAPLGPDLGDFCDTAAVIQLLDLVICVDTSVAHLAGALGKPVWLLLPRPADWRWLDERDDSPWYPTMRLFRQRVRGEWAEVIARVRAALDEWAADPAPRSEARPVPAPAAMVPALSPVTRPGVWPGHRPGMSAVAATRHGLLQFLPDDGDLAVSLDWYGEWLQPQLTLLATLLRPGATVLEAGAGIGAHAVALAAVTGAQGHLLAYEAQPMRAAILRLNLALERIGPVTIMRAALGEPGEGAPTVDSLRLERLDAIKVAGGASPLAVLEGSIDTLWRLRPLLFLAAADDTALALLAARVREFGYRCWRMETKLFAPGNFNQRTDDVFGGRRALALLAVPEEVEVAADLDGCTELAIPP